jgi:hypothetical protein
MYSSYVITICLYAIVIVKYGYPYTNIISNNTPENFKTALQMSKDKLLSDPDGPRILNINCWNEWTEGSYLEPDTEYGYGFLEAVRDVFN